MADFPMLKTGAVAQDGLQMAVRFGTRVIRFADATEQRFRERSGPRRRWVVRLDLLTGDELHMVTGFLAARQGRHGVFSFFDPWSETTYPHCTLESDAHEASLNEVERSSLVIRIREN